MSRRIMITAALALATLGLAACGDEQDPQLAERTLSFTERDTDNFGFVDAAPKTKLGEQGPERLSNGDAITFSSDLLGDGGKDAGDLDVSCAVTRPGGFDAAHLHCTGTATLPGGTLTLTRGGRVFGGASPVGAVLGGSGSYEGATGEFTEGEERGGSTPYTFHVWLPQD